MATGQDARQNNRFVQLIKPEAENIIALSDSLSDELYNTLWHTPRHSYSFGIDETMFDALPETRTIDIMGAGSLIPIETIWYVHPHHFKTCRPFSGLNCIICGDGPEREHLQRLINENGLVNNIRLLQDHCLIEVYWRSCSLRDILHTSSYEGI